MKKVILLLVALFLVGGCSCSNDKAADAVEKYLNDYQGLSKDVLEDISELVEKEDLSDSEKATYEEVLKRQYRNISFKIENEEYNCDSANVTVKITVYDLHKAEKEAKDYLDTHEQEFLSDGAYDASKYLDYKLDRMRTINETVTYNIVIKTVKVDGKWQVSQPDSTTLEKIHGIYDYD